MKRIAPIAFLVLVAASSARAGDAITVRATPVASGADPAALFDAQLAAEIAQGQACATGGCGSTVAREQRVAGNMLVYAVFLTAAPSCARVVPHTAFPDGSIFDTYRARVVGHGVVMRRRPDTGSPSERVVVRVRA